MARSFTLRQVADKNGNPILNAKCEAYNVTTGVVAETAWTNTAGTASFTALPDAGTVVNIRISWGLGHVEWREDIFMEAVSISADHGSLGGLTDDDHTQYRLESADHTHQSTGTQAGQLDHGLALTGLTDDDHTQYVLEASTDASGYGFVVDEDTMVSDLATKVPTQQSVKAYVDENKGIKTGAAFPGDAALGDYFHRTDTAKLYKCIEAYSGAESTVSVRTAAQNDDCFIWGTTNIDLDAVQVNMGYAPTNRYSTGMRFLGVTIPNGTTVTTAYIRFTAYYSDAVGGMKVDIYAENNNAAATFSTHADYDGRTTTTAKVDWDFDTAWVSGSTYDTPSITTIIQELVGDYSGLAAANVAILLKEDTCDANAIRRPCSYDQATEAFRPLLYIVYVTDVASKWLEMPDDTAVAADIATHAALTTGVHGVGAGTVAKTADIAVDANLSVAAQAVVTAGACDVDANLSAAAQAAISASHTAGTDTALGAMAQNIDFNEHQAVDMSIHTVADATARAALTSTLAKIVYQKNTCELFFRGES